VTIAARSDPKRLATVHRSLPEGVDTPRWISLSGTITMRYLMIPRCGSCQWEEAAHHSYSSIPERTSSGAGAARFTSKIRPVALSLTPSVSMSSYIRLRKGTLSLLHVPLMA